ncbi:MAG: tail fiber domain-containing protein [Candidatus Entotheonellia bacterium]
MNASDGPQLPHVLTEVVDTAWSISNGANVMNTVKILLFVGLIFLTNQSVLVAQTYTFPGSVGIDTLSPQRKLHVEGDFLISGPESLIYLDRFGGPYSGLAYFSSKNPEPPYIQWMHHKDGGEPVRYGYIQSGDFGTTKEFRFAVENNAKFTFLNGDVGIGTANPAYKLDVAGGAHATSFPTSSDVRLKREVRPLTQALEKLAMIRGISFEWNDLYESLGRSTGHREIGVIAQEVETVFPELVTQWGEENYRAVDYGRLTAVLIEAVKEIKAQQDAQQQYIIGLEARLAALEQAKGGNGGPMQLSSFPAVWLLFAAVVGLLSNSWRRWKK